MKNTQTHHGIALNHAACVKDSGPNSRGNSWALVETSSGEQGILPNVLPKNLDHLPKCNCNDLHLEFFDENKVHITPNSKVFSNTCPARGDDVCVLAGDIGQVRHGLLKSFLQACAARWRYVIYVAGNHEFYATRRHPLTISDILEQTTQMCQEIGVIFLNRSTYQIAGVKFVGATLWYNTDQAQCSFFRDSFGDYKSILSQPLETPPSEAYGRKWEQRFRLSVADVASMNREDTDFFKQALVEAESDPLVSQVICVSHHPPTRHLTSDPVYSNMYLDEAIQSSTKLTRWICGHTHRMMPIHMDLFSEQRMLLCNTVGYKDEFDREGLPKWWQDTKDLPGAHWETINV